MWCISAVCRFGSTKPRELAAIAAGRLSHLPYIPADARRDDCPVGCRAVGGVRRRDRRLRGAAQHFLAVLLVVAGAIGQPLLRAILIVEHTGCSQDTNGLTNTRTTLDEWPVRLLMWNMPFHAEHHLYPSIPFYQLPHAHQHLAKKLTHLAPSYVAANQSVVRSLRTAPPRNDLSRA